MKNFRFISRKGRNLTIILLFNLKLMQIKINLKAKKNIFSKIGF
jgi:hypothetical protein